MNKSILIVHPSADLYGADRVLIQIATTLKSEGNRVQIVLPYEGPLQDELEKLNVNVDIDPSMPVLRLSNMKLSKLGLLPNFLRRIAETHNDVRSYDLVYINTLAVALYGLGSAFSGIQTIVHIHEIPSRSLSAIFSVLLTFIRPRILFVSQATRQRFWLSTDNYRIVHNGVTSPTNSNTESPSSKRLKILLIGRLNAWKGQGLLVKAVAELGSLADEIEVRLVGDVFADQTQFQVSLSNQIAQHNLSGSVSLVEFTDDPSHHYQWCDVVCIPSTRPDPFPLVALETGSFGKPAIAAAFGGLPEVIENGVNGLLFEPNDHYSLATKIRWALDNRQRLKEMGDKAKAIHESKYTESKFRDRLRAAIQ